MQLKLDKAGRIVVPKRIRERFQFQPGTPIEVEEDAGGIRLLSNQPPSRLVWENGVPVFAGEPLPGVDWDRLVDNEREERIRKIAGS